jgi:hypothetical protein
MNMFEVVLFLSTALVSVGVFEEMVLPVTEYAVNFAKPVVDQAINFVNPVE